MTLIWAKKVLGKWNLYCDDWVSYSNTMSSAKKYWRPKLRKMQSIFYSVWTVSAWDTQDVDVLWNKLYERVTDDEFPAVEDWMLWILQDLILEVTKEIKEIKDWEPSMNLICLIPETNEVYVVNGYSVFKAEDDAEIVMGSWSTEFYWLGETTMDFDTKFALAVYANEFCQQPIYICDWDVVESVWACFTSWTKYYGKPDEWTAERTFCFSRKIIWKPEQEATETWDKD